MFSLYVIAGPKGAGKTTFSMRMKSHADSHLSPPHARNWRLAGLC